ncbi:bacteriophage holin [Allokutzneria sp. A3M-2-11 16]|uniref:bacteriophage holin n=1 Tax=Allokutzneria sp. A3M-2-11 16 TaxID=2962043 RepID=UPI0020B70679|nr:bacteriophage holin [Allokutzneria sp. A3M-2-11 16]MCP3803718.1 bacteriophage holin [Allokutzneria sp. A3M-2-11 16]
MPYLLSLLLVVAGLVVLVVVAVKVFRSLSRFGAAYAAAGRHVDDRAGLLRARSAALKVAIAERRSTKSTDSDDSSARTI